MLQKYKIFGLLIALLLGCSSGRSSSSDSNVTSDNYIILVDSNLGTATIDVGTSTTDVGASDSIAINDTGINTGKDSQESSNVIFFDDFESGDLSKSTNGFKWATTTSKYGNISVSSAIVHSGKHAVKAQFLASTYNIIDLSFDLGKEYKEIYVRFFIYYPNGNEQGENKYYHRALDDQSEYNQLIRIFGEKDSDNSKMGMSTRAQENNGLSKFFFELRNKCIEKMNPAENLKEWVMTDTDLGRWIEVQIHLKPDPGSGKGIAELSIDGKKVITSTSIKQKGAPCNPGFFSRGYLLGWTTSGFDKDTNIYIDNITFSTNPI